MPDSGQGRQAWPSNSEVLLTLLGMEPLTGRGPTNLIRDPRRTTARMVDSGYEHLTAISAGLNLLLNRCLEFRKSRFAVHYGHR